MGPLLLRCNPQSKKFHHHLLAHQAQITEMLYPLDLQAEFSVAAISLLPTRMVEGSGRGIREAVEDLEEAELTPLVPPLIPLGLPVHKYVLVGETAAEAEGDSPG
jgi:hypothetical protein